MEKEVKKTVFISYSRNDKNRIRGLVSALESEGFDVWWDVEIPPGKRFVDVIYQALQSADNIIVAWSKTSIKSEWVRREAELGLERKVLLPILLDNSLELPFLFRDRHACNFITWKGDRSHIEYLNLIDAIKQDSLGADINNKISEGVIKEEDTTNKSHKVPLTEKPILESVPTPEEESKPYKKILIFPILFFLLILGAVLLNAGRQTESIVSNSSGSSEAKVLEAQQALETQQAREAKVLEAQRALKAQQAREAKVLEAQRVLEAQQAREAKVLEAQRALEAQQAREAKVLEAQRVLEAQQARLQNEIGGKYTPRLVKADPKLILRKKPSIHSTGMDAVSKGKLLLISDRVSDRVIIGDKEGYWFKTKKKHGRNALYVFDGYLGYYPVYKVAANSGLTIRQMPKVNSKKLSKLDNGTKVYSLSIQSGTDSVDKVNGRWHKVHTGDIEGYMFGAYLTKEN